MGFCRRCGDIVSGQRCKCGGTPADPVVSWKESMNVGSVQDRWSKTYVARDKSPTRSPSPTKRFPQPLNYSTSASSSHSPLGNRVSAHIANTTSRLTNRPPSPLKNSVIAPESGILPSLAPHATGSLAKVYGSVLQPAETLNSHACSSCHTVFQPDSTIYPGPTTGDEPQFLCRNCFVQSCSKGSCPTCSWPVLPLKSEGPFIDGGDGHFYHKACYNCHGCGKNIGDSPMVDLLGHPSCTSCFDTCLQRDRTPRHTPKPTRTSTSTSNSPNVKIGGFASPSRNSKGGRESSPAVVEELEQRLGITKSRESSPELEELSQRLNMLGRESMNGSPRNSRSYVTSAANSPVLRSADASPSPKRLSQPRLDRSVGPEGRDSASRPSSVLASRSRPTTPSPAPTEEQIEEMKRRFIKSLTPSSSPQPDQSFPPIRRRLRSMRSSGSLSQLPNLSSSPPGTPDLTSDYSDTTTQSSGPDSPPRNSDFGQETPSPKNYTTFSSRYSRMNNFNDDDDVIIEETNSQLTTPTRTPNTKADDGASKTTPSKPRVFPKPKTTPEKRPQSQPESATCAKCRRVLFSIREGGQYVTVPDEASGIPKTYHRNCFTCVVCDKAFQEGQQGQAMFVKAEKGPCHLQCAPPAKITVKTVHPSDSLPPIRPRTLSATPSPSGSTSTNGSVASSSRYNRPASNSLSATAPRFGSSSTCPGCKKSVSPMERGVVPGPQGTRWHQTCLVCGGKRTPSTLFYKPREEKKNEPGCGKKLDSAAKGDGEGNVFCRECWLIIRDPPQSSSPGRSPLLPNHTGGKVAPQFTGTTTIARQFTGLGGGDPLVRQLTGGGLSPTRSISPTKQLGMVAPGTIRPRPKSVIGMRNSKSVDEGRGMFLVRQMTGGNNNTMI
ncbi:hypothetical protein K435DRAFT_758827 [Dendrothele bispora CBS 962.96]|uniref:LIM zinc-binding domain-containing protein n=1 Tax=Dendrothele bispora (strain CBS 962.96) TaxID=1314807 RepID=A0A4S8LR73_DENBC|nr:hypothetical protein K435DRAFT_758827 [Dendrothele bispora CBS 962.96]